MLGEARAAVSRSSPARAPRPGSDSPPRSRSAARAPPSRSARPPTGSTTQAAALQAMGYEAAGFVADLVDRAQVRELVGAVLARFGRIDILVNNAGMVTVDDPDGRRRAAFLTLTDERLGPRPSARNLGTAYNVTRAVMPGMVERGWGRVVMVSSVTGPVVTDPGRSGYSAAKAGMDGLMRAVAIEVGHAGVTVNSVAPGGSRRARNSPSEATAGRHTPIGRSGTPRGGRRGDRVPRERPRELRDRHPRSSSTAATRSRRPRDAEGAAASFRERPC